MAAPGTSDLDIFNEHTKLMKGELATFKTEGACTVQMRKCPNPKCGVITEKNMGCDHMTCGMCQHQYYWSTGKPYVRPYA